MRSIVPAILANDYEEFNEMLRQAEAITDYIQIDFMDGVFVPSTSVSPDLLVKSKPAVDIEAHLMVSDPVGTLSVFRNSRVKKVIFHYEAVRDRQRVAGEIKWAGFEVGLAINPETAVEKIIDLPEIDSYLLLSVHPGFYGKEFIIGTLKKIEELRNRIPEAVIGVDGGIKLDNVSSVIDAGADYACIGSAIFKADDPGAALDDFILKVGK